ncbi:MAG TPA: UDP-2,3-diacylglucosamine diphosphatase [Caulobacteraceae bacterium]|nr:UDP-2,3-diacylglucosamine diphosphatase [Caulobacteraceae bacterium]
MDDERRSVRCRTAFISDTHLGTRGCQAERLLDFIRALDCQTLYLVGDIIDGWRLKENWYWPQAHNDIVQKILRLARKGVRVIYIPGNHDAFGRDFVGLDFGGVAVRREAIHRGADGRSWLVTHGDDFDVAAGGSRLARATGSLAYRALMRSHRAVGTAQRLLGFGHWSLAAFVKRHAPQARAIIARFETALAAEAARRGLDGVVCGHIHNPQSRTIDGVAYVNDGDWVDSCTAAVEREDGRMEVLHWPALAAAPAAARGVSLFPESSYSPIAR